MSDASDSKGPAPVLSGDKAMDVHLGYLRRDVDEMKTTLVRSFEQVNKTLKEIQDGHPTRIEFTEMVAIVTNKLDVASFAEHLKADEDHERRIRTLEAAMWKYVGAAGAIGAAGAMLMSFILSKL